MTCSPRVPAAYVGITTPNLQRMLTQAQQALADLTTGGKVETAAYTQGDGSKSVTFTRAQIGILQSMVSQLARILYPGQGYGSRRPARIIYR